MAFRPRIGDTLDIVVSIKITEDTSFDWIFDSLGYDASVFRSFTKNNSHIIDMRHIVPNENVIALVPGGTRVFTISDD